MQGVRVQELEWDLTVHQKLQGVHVDIILGADCLYDRSTWDDFLAVVYYLLSRSVESGSTDHRDQPPRFIGCHQLRNSSHTIAPHIEHWGLSARALPTPSIVGQIEPGGITSDSAGGTLGLFELTLAR